MTIDPTTLSRDAFLRQVTSFELFQDTTRISAAQLFDQAYGDLDALFEYNASQRGCAEDAVSREQRQRMIDSWKDSTHNKRLAVRMRWHDPTDGQKEVRAEVKVRSNFDHLRERRPSIIPLSDSQGRTYYLRLLVDHTQSSSIFSDFRDLGVKTTNDPKTMEHLAQKRVIDPSWNYRLRRREIRPIENRKFEKPYVYIPETHLFYVLENLYLESVPRVTPRARVVEMTLDYICLIRSPLLQVGDLGLDAVQMGRLGRYFGVFHSLGLSDIYDRQLEHYAIQPSLTTQEEPTIVNYDPDFMILDRRSHRSRRAPLSIDIRLFYERFTSAYPVVSRAEWRSFFAAYRDTIDVMEQKYPRLDVEFYSRLCSSLIDYNRFRIE